MLQLSDQQPPGRERGQLSELCGESDRKVLVWSEEGCKKVSKRGDLEADPQGEWALVGVQGKHDGHCHSEDVRLPGGSRAQGVD